MKYILGTLLFIGMIFAINEFQIFGMKFWGVKIENARREIFEETKSYNHGIISDMYRYKLEYTTASLEHKQALRDVINSSLGGFDRTKLPYDLQLFVQQINK